MESLGSISQADLVPIRNLCSTRYANPLGAVSRARQRVRGENVRNNLAMALVSSPARRDRFLPSHAHSTQAERFDREWHSRLGIET